MDVQANIKAIWDADPGLQAAGLTPLYAMDEAPADQNPPLAEIALVEEEATERTSESVYSMEGYQVTMYGLNRDIVAEYLQLFRKAFPDGSELRIPSLHNWCLLVRENRKRYVKVDDGAFRPVWSCEVDLEVTLRRLRNDGPILG